MAKLLLVEDDAKMATMVIDRLTFERYTVEYVDNGDLGMEMVRSGDFDLLILDWNLPGASSGLDIVRRYRLEGGKAPVLMLTGNQTVSDKELGLESGADDYLTKPFHPRELVARVKALMRRFGDFVGDNPEVKGIRLDRNAHTVTQNGQPLTLTVKEFDLLELFLRHPNQVFSEENLLQRVWGSENEAGPAAVHSCIKRLRKKLGREDLIVSVYGAGYKMET